MKQQQISNKFLSIRTYTQANPNITIIKVTHYVC